MLIWEMPHNNNAPILGYEVMYESSDYEQEDVVNTNFEMVNVSGLTSDTNYSFYVFAYNMIGISAPSNPLIVTTLVEADGESLNC